MFLFNCPHSHMMALLLIANNREFYCEDPDRKRQLHPRPFLFFSLQRWWRRWSQPLARAFVAKIRVLKTMNGDRRAWVCWRHEEHVFVHRFRMPRVNRTAVLTLLIVSSSVFLLFQLYYYRKYVSKVRHRDASAFVFFKIAFPHLLDLQFTRRF